MRNELIELNSDNEYQEIVKFLKELGEDVKTYIKYTPNWNILEYINFNWELTDINRLKQPFNLISYSDFINKYSKKEEPTTTGLDKYKVYIKGYKGRGEEVIQKLESLGGKNLYKLGGWGNSYYYINEYDRIVDCVDLDLTDKTELFLDGPVKEPEKVEVFPGIYIGDVVVSLQHVFAARKKGDIFKVSSESKKNSLCYTNNCSSSIHEWRLATSEEKEAFEKGITNINDIKKEPEEDFSKFIGQWVTWDGWSAESVCKVTKIEKYSFAGNNCRIYFDEAYVHYITQFSDNWTAIIKELEILSKEELEDYLPEDVYMKEFPENIIPEYLELLPDYSNEVTGTIFKTSEPYKQPTIDWIKANSWQDFWDNIPKHHKRYFKTSTKKEYEKQYIRPKFIKDVDPTVKSTPSTSLQDYLKSIPDTFSDKLEGFPKEIVQKMVERQFEQGNEPDFEKVFGYDKSQGGFNWRDTIEGADFWCNVHDINFKVFYEKYPKTETEVTLTNVYNVEGDIYGILTSDGKTVEFDLSHYKNEYKAYIDPIPEPDSSNSLGYSLIKTEKTKTNTFDHLPFVQVKELSIF
jgi:hypothetical protein